MKLTYKQLKAASILDLTDDLEVMRKAMDYESFEPSDVAFWSDDGKMFSLYDFAHYTQDTLLLNRLDRIFRRRMDRFFNE